MPRHRETEPDERALDIVHKLLVGVASVGARTRAATAARCLCISGAKAVPDSLWATVIMLPPVPTEDRLPSQTLNPSRLE